jgi:hypothetical protein
MMIKVERKTSTRNSPDLRHDILLIFRYASVMDETYRQKDLMAPSIKITPREQVVNLRRHEEELATAV